MTQRNTDRNTARWLLDTAKALALTAGLCAWSGANAQYPGEIFIEPWSTGVEAGGTTTLEIKIFLGAKDFAYAAGLIRYDPQEVTMKQPAVPKLWANDVDARFQSKPGVAEFEIVTRWVGDRAIYGGLGLMEITAHALSPPGTVIELELELIKAGCIGGCGYEHRGAVPAELVVVAPGTTVPPWGSSEGLDTPYIADASDPLVRRARRLARGIGMINLVVTNGGGQVERRWVQSGHVESFE